MTTIFKLSTTAALAVFALVGAARAQDVRITIDGKDAKTVHAEIIDAAYTVCRESDAAELNTASQSDCVSATIDKAEAEFHRLGATHVTRVASAQITPAHTGER